MQWGKTFRYGLRLVRVTKLLVLIYAVCFLLSGLVAPLTATVFGYVTNHLQQIAQVQPTTGEGEIGQPPGLDAPADKEETIGEERRGILAYYSIWVLLALLGIPLGILCELANTRMDGVMANHLKKELFEKIIRQAPEFFHRHNPGQLTMVVNYLSKEAQMTMRSLVIDPILQVVLFVIVGGLMTLWFSAVAPAEDVPLVYKIGVLLVAAASPLVVARMGRQLQEASATMRDVEMDISGLVTGTLQSPEEIQLMKAEEMFTAKHHQALDRLLKADLRQSRSVETLNALSGLPMLVAQAVILGFGLYLALGAPGQIQVGAIVALVGLVPSLMSPVQSLANYMVMARTAWPSIETVTEILEAENRTSDSPGARDISEMEPTLAAKNLSFSYAPGGRLIFDRLSFEAPPGKITGLVARIGQGKTTFFRLALRFYDPNEGEILLGGHRTADFTLNSLRRHVGMMSQYPAFFHGSLRENIRIAKPEASDEEIKAICQKTRIWQEVLEPNFGPNPLDMHLSAEGLPFSGGQRKWLALTRCLLRDPTFLFLDEPTTNMDNEIKSRLLPIIREACAGRTVMVVDHDVQWLVSLCDHFVVLDQGRVVQQGSAEELLGPVVATPAPSAKGLLAELYFRSADEETEIFPQ